MGFFSCYCTETLYLRIKGGGPAHPLPLAWQSHTQIRASTLLILRDGVTRTVLEPCGSVADQSRCSTALSPCSLCVVPALSLSSCPALPASQ